MAESDENDSTGITAPPSAAMETSSAAVALAVKEGDSSPPDDSTMMKEEEKPNDTTSSSTNEEKKNDDEKGDTNDKDDEEKNKKEKPPLTEEEKKKYANWPFKNIKEPHANDVLFGRGGGTNHHSGNKLYRRMVEERKVEYVNCKRLDKPLVALGIIKEWRSQVPPGRFLKMDDKTGCWNDVGDKKAREKTSQALREKAPQIRLELEKEKRAKERAERGEPPEWSDDDDLDNSPTPQKVTRFAEGTDGRPGMVARDHSLGRDYVSDAGVSLDNFTWFKDAATGERVLSGGSAAAYGPPPYGGLPFGYPGSRTPSGTIVPPPPQPYGYVTSYDSRVMSWTSTASNPQQQPSHYTTGYPPPPQQQQPPQPTTSWSHRDHSLANNPLSHTNVSQPGYPHAFDSQQRAASGQWGVLPPPPPPGGFAPPYTVVSSSGSMVQQQMQQQPMQAPMQQQQQQQQMQQVPIQQQQMPQVPIQQQQQMQPQQVQHQQQLQMQPQAVQQQQQQQMQHVPMQQLHQPPIQAPAPAHQQAIQGQPPAPPMHPQAPPPPPMHPQAPPPPNNNMYMTPHDYDHSNSSNTSAYSVSPAVASQWSNTTTTGADFPVVPSTPPPPSASNSSNTTPKPDMVKRATSHQNETAETKLGYSYEQASVKRATLDREHSLASSRLKAQYSSTGSNREEKKEEQGVVRRPAALTLEERMSTLDLEQQQGEEGGDKKAGDKASGGIIANKPPPLTYRASTMEALALDFDNPPDTMPLPPLHYQQQGLEDLFAVADVPKPSSLTARMTTRDLIDIVNEPFEEV